MEDRIDHGVGVTLSAKVGDEVRRGDVLATLRFNDPGLAARASELVERAYLIGDIEPDKQPLILETVI